MMYLSSWVLGMKVVLVAIQGRLTLRRRRCFTLHPHGTPSHGVGLVFNVISGGTLVMTFNRDGMGGDMEVFGLEGIRMGSTLLYSVA